LAKLATVALDGCYEREGDPHNLAPTVSTSVALALGDALAVTLMVARGFGPDDFKTFHPGGALGKMLNE
jgi:arabinose-5-phosphate isomerase